jgi:hypothetical protein
MKVTVLIDYSTDTDDELVTDGQKITGKMKGNIYFPAPIPELDAVVLALAEFITALAECSGGTHETTVKNKKRANLENALKKLGLYVQLNCKDDPSIVDTTGYETRKDPESKGVLPAPSVKVEVGPFPGSIKVSVNKVDGAHTYLYEWKELPSPDNATWEFDLGTTSIIIKNLKQGKEYAFKVAAKGAAKDLIFSNIVTHFVA